MRVDDILHVRTVLLQGTALVSLDGELDLATAPLVTRAVTRILAERPDRLDVDVAGLAFCDVVGLRALSQARRAARLHGAGFHLVGIHSRLHRILALLHATDVLPPAPV